MHNSTQLFSDIPYRQVGSKTLLLDLYVPTGEAPLPLVVWIHGGAWLMGDNKQPPAVPLLTDNGFAVASITYRFSQEAIFPAQIQDSKAAVRWLRAHAHTYNLHPDKVGAWGVSAGGYLAALLGLAVDVPAFEDGDHLDQRSDVQAVCDWFGPTDFLQMDLHMPAHSTYSHDAAGSPESKLVGGPIQENRDKVAQANPITYITQNHPPFLIMHGDQDQEIPLHQSQLIHKALVAANVEVTFQPVAGAGHGGEAFQTEPVLQMVLAFFNKYLKPNGL
jgi:acetyl esterase/lipase